MATKQQQRLALIMPATSPLVAPPAADAAEFMIVTPDMALSWLENYPYEKQRPLTDSHVAMLVQRIAKGQFEQNTRIGLCWVEGTLYLYDGQHRLAAVVNSGKPQSFLVHITSRATMTDLAWLYSNTDIGKRRSVADLYNAMDLADELELSKKQLTNLGAAVGFLATGMKSQAAIGDKDQLLYYIRLYAPAMREYLADSAGSPMNGTACRRASTIALALLTYRYYPTSTASRRYKPTLYQFWHGMLCNDASQGDSRESVGLAKNDARHVGYEHLRFTTMRNGQRMGSREVTPMLSARVLAACFNSFMTGKPMTKQPTIKNQTDDLVIVGVPAAAAWMLP